MQPKRLHRVKDGAVVAGVVAGLAKYFDHDPVLFRVLAIAVTLLSGVFPGALVYLIAWLIIPEEPTSTSSGAATYTVVE